MRRPTCSRLFSAAEEREIAYNWLYHKGYIIKPVISIIFGGAFVVIDIFSFLSGQASKILFYLPIQKIYLSRTSVNALQLISYCNFSF